MDYYDYKELETAATAHNAPQTAIDALGEWFEHHGAQYWSGECYTARDGLNLYPVYRELGEDEYEIAGYTFSADFADPRA